jgi:hypothetical protein
MLLELLTEVFSEMDVKTVKNYYEGSKITNVLGMGCKVWYACLNNCMISLEMKPLLIVRCAMLLDKRKWAVLLQVSMLDIFY